MGKQIYDKPVRELMKDMVADLGFRKGELFLKKQVVEWFNKHYPRIKPSTITANMTLLSTNAPTRTHYNAKPSDDLFFQIDGSIYRLYDSNTDPTPIYEGENGSPRDKPKAKLVNEVSKLIDKYARNVEEEIGELEGRIGELEQENERLRSKLTQEKRIADYIVDDLLRKRIALLGSTPPLDTLIREAGVILEERIRIVGKADSRLYGVDLIDAVFNPKSGSLIFSVHPGEQDGVRMLFRGAIQFIRNPPMHKPIEYPEVTARTLMIMIDSLLQLLSGIQTGPGGVTLEAVRLMLSRAPIPASQRQLYKILYAAGEQGMTNVDLAAALDITRLQFAGVLGALGRRVNNTKGLENKGGVIILFDIETIEGGNMIYVMRPVLRKAIEEEGLV